MAECELTAISLNMVAAGVGLCLADPISSVGIGSALVRRPFEPVAPYEVGLIGPAHGGLTVLAQAFAELLHTHIISFVEP